MNSSSNTHSKIPSECELYTFLGGTLDHTTTEANAVIVFLIIMNIITFPITSVSNLLLIIAVKTKPRLKTMSNIALSCLATTDAAMGVVGQPCFIAELTLVLQGEVSSAHCSLITLSKNILRVLGLTSLLHLSLVNMERYIAIKHPFEHISMVTTVRMIRSSAFMWFLSSLTTTPLEIIDIHFFLTFTSVMVAFCAVIIIFCQVELYYETRRHKKAIATQQVSVEARQKFLKDKKAFTLTTIVLLFLVSSYLPFLIFRISIVNNIISSENVVYIAFTITSFVIILNSLINPIIYCTRIRQFRVAFIEIIFRKSYVRAEDIEIRVFGRLNVVVPFAEGQNNEQENEPQWQ